MSDMVDTFKAMREHVRQVREKYGIACPECRIKQPNRCATILLPQQRCKVDGYVDPRPDLTDNEFGDV